MNRIYTRRGDGGTTSLHGGIRVDKTDSRIEANGVLDELNVAIGIARAHIAPGDAMQHLLRDIQLTLMTAMSRVATPLERLSDNPNLMPADAVERMEQTIDYYTRLAGDAGHFVLPGGNVPAAFLHQARVTARRAERALWRADAEHGIDRDVTRYVNRLSDLLFTLARYSAAVDGTEERWHQFNYYRK